jgi:deoxyguanosine kinase
MQYLIIEGNIGAGKTTLAKMISENRNGRLITERINDIPFLPKFYDQPERYSFQLELSFLADRYHQINEELNNLDLFHPLTISDYYIMKSLIFSKINLNPDEYKLYRQIFDMIYHNTTKPDLLVYLHTSFNNLVRNIKNRGRFFEQQIQVDYLVKIQEGYMEFFKTQLDLPILILDITNLDFVNNQDDFEAINSVIFNNSLKPGINKVQF